MDKCESVIEMEAPTTKKDIMELYSMFMALNRFISRSVNHTLPFFRLLKKCTHIDWTLECEQAFISLKMALYTPSVLSRPKFWEILFLYLVVSTK